MKNKGFTLIEMIITIALMSIIGIVLSVSLMGVLKNQDEKDYQDFIKIIEESACAYTSLSRVDCDSGCTVTGSTLVSEGMIDEEINGFMSSDYSVNVTFTDGLKECKIEE